jgi:bifunctional non-homologous end joining protein LigD
MGNPVPSQTEVGMPFAWTPPMLATLTDARFDDPEWIYERKFDGIRCLAVRGADGRVGLLSRNQQSMTVTYPEVADDVARQSSSMVLDGEVVAFLGRQTSFERLQQRSGIHAEAEARASKVRVTYCVFDLLSLDGEDLRARPLRERKRLLRDAVTWGGSLRWTVHRNGIGIATYEAACRRGDEGVIAKRADGPYAAGRSKDWLKFKCVHGQEFVVGGFTDPAGSRVGFGALLLGYYDGDRLVYAGGVGTGFNTELLTTLRARLDELTVENSPFGAAKIAEAHAHWVRPEIVAQVGFAEWTRDGLLRQARFQGLRTDKAATDVVRERPS